MSPSHLYSHMWPSGLQKAAVHLSHLHDYGYKEHNRRWRKPCTCWKERAELCTPGILILVNFGKYIVYHYWAMRLLNRCSDLRKWMCVRQLVLGTRNMLMVVYVQMTREIYWVWIQYPLTWLHISSNYRKCDLYDVVLDIKCWTHNFPFSGIVKTFWPPWFSALGPRNLCFNKPCRRFWCTLRFEIHSCNSSTTNSSDVSSYCVWFYCAGGFCRLSLNLFHSFCFVR